MEFGLLGPLQIDSPDGEIPIRSARQRALLAALLVDAGHVVSVDTLVAHVWADHPPDHARAALQVRIVRLRRLLDPAGVTIENRQAGYALRLAHADDLDIARFDRLVAAAGATSDPAERSALLHQALRLWRGPALADVPVVALREVAVRLDERRLAVLEQRIDADLDRGEHQALVAELRGLTLQHPLREGFWAQLMVALAGAGQQAEALTTYREVAARLADELGVDPGERLRAAHRQVLTEGTGQPADLAWPAPRLLPADVADFTGRAAEFAALHTALTRDGAALTVVTISGMGGVGKTALAVHLAHRLAPSFPDGQLFVNLRGAEASPLDPGDVLLQFLGALGVAGRTVPADQTERAGLFRSRLAGRRVLVVLDNAAAESQIRPLLPGAGTCAVIVTSRAALPGLAGATALDLRVPDADEAIRFLERVTGPDRIAAGPGAATEIVGLCGRLPLAVRIAGARLAARPTWTLTHLAALLRDQHRRLDHLAAGDLGVRACLALSYHALGEAPRRLLRMLGLFDTPDFPAWMSAALLGRPLDSATTHLETLVDARLLTIVGTDDAGQSRYRFHDLVRLFARERAHAEDTEQARAAALTAGFGGWLMLAERMATRIPGPCYAVIHGDAPRTAFPGDTSILGTDALAWFDAEWLTLQATVRQAAELNRDELTFDLAGCLEKYLDLRGMYAEWRALNERALATCQATGNLRGQAVMLRGLVDVRAWTDDAPGGSAMARMLDDAVRLLDMFTALRHLGGMADAGVFCAWAHAARGDIDQALDTATSSLALAERAGHLGGRARAYVAMSVALGERQQYDVAVSLLTKALDLTRELGNPRYEATVLQFLGIGHTGAGDLGAAEQALLASRAISHRYRDLYPETLTMLALARLYAAQRDPRATDLATAALAVGREHTMIHHVADALTVLGEITLADGRAGGAVTHLTEAVRLWRTRGWPSFLATALFQLGRAHAGTHDHEAAVAAWREARELFATLGNDDRVAEIDRLLRDDTSCLAA